jgi:RNA recognition motif-containing protein
MLAAAHGAVVTTCAQCSTTPPLTCGCLPLARPLQVGGLEVQLSEQELDAVFEPYGPLVEVRLVRDKYTQAPRGFGFVEYQSIADASKALHALQVGRWLGLSCCCCCCECAAP